MRIAAIETKAQIRAVVRRPWEAITIRSQAYHEHIDPSQVATRPGEVGDKTVSDWVVADDEDDGDRRSCGLGCDRRSRTSRRDDHRDPPTNQIGRQAR